MLEIHRYADILKKTLFHDNNIQYNTYYIIIIINYNNIHRVVVLI